MNTVTNRLKAVSLLFLTLLWTSPLFSQLSKSEVPKVILVQDKENIPRQMQFVGDKLIVKTDPTLKSGTQYTVEYQVVWKGKKFNLMSINEISTSIDEEGALVTTTTKNADIFGYSYLKNWELRVDSNGKYTLSSKDNSDYQWVFIPQ